MKEYAVLVKLVYGDGRYEVKLLVKAENRAQAEWITENKWRDAPTLVNVQVRDSEE